MLFLSRLSKCCDLCVTGKLIKLLSKYGYASLNFILPIKFPKPVFLLFLPWSLVRTPFLRLLVPNPVIWPSLSYPFYTASSPPMSVFPSLCYYPRPNFSHLVLGPLHYTSNASAWLYSHILPIHSTHNLIMLIFQNYQFHTVWLKFYIPIPSIKSSDTI